MSDGVFRRLSRALAELFGLITLRIVYGGRVRTFHSSKSI